MAVHSIEIQPAIGPVNQSFQPPGSKSLTNRALLIAALADGTSTLQGVLESDDTEVMRTALRSLGIQVHFEPANHTATVTGCGGVLPNRRADIHVGNSGTSIRFLTAMLGFAGGTYRLDGIPRMRQRPIGPLVQALNGLGGQLVAESAGVCPPVVIDQANGIAGGSVALSGNLSSQFLSGLLMAAPLAKEQVELQIEGNLISRPYVEMTCAVMQHFGVTVEESSSNRFTIAGAQAYRAADYSIEPDASAASYFWATAAILGGSATITGLNEQALQGDVGFVRCLEKMGCRVVTTPHSIQISGPATHGANLDMGDVSDTVQTLAAVALFVDGPTTITNIAHNRVKETDRIGNLAVELRKLGARVDEQADGMTIHPGPLQSAEIETYDDHRMAMSLALVGLKQPGITILDPGCVSKTYPHYFRDLQSFLKS